MEDFSAAISKIEDFMRVDFGERPNLQLLTFKNLLDADARMYPDSSLFVRIAKARKNLETGNPFYNYKLHTIFIPKDSAFSSLVHECTHAYTRNHWPELYRYTPNREEYIVDDIINEGLAEYVSHQIAPGSRIRREILLNWAGKPDFHPYTQDNLDKMRDKLIVSVSFEEEIKPIARYGIGALVVADVLERQKDKYAMYEGLVKNMPRTIRAVTSIIDPKIYETYWECKHNRLKIFIINKILGDMED